MRLQFNAAKVERDRLDSRECGSTGERNRPPVAAQRLRDAYEIKVTLHLPSDRAALITAVHEYPLVPHAAAHSSGDESCSTSHMP